jgi:hypothetical protein
MSWRYAKEPSFKPFIKERTLKVAVENTLKNEATIENGVVHVVPCNNVRNM